MFLLTNTIHVKLNLFKLKMVKIKLKRTINNEWHILISVCFLFKTVLSSVKVQQNNKILTKCWQKTLIQYVIVTSAWLCYKTTKQFSYLCSESLLTPTSASSTSNGNRNILFFYKFSIIKEIGICQKQTLAFPPLSPD